MEESSAVNLVILGANYQEQEISIMKRYFYNFLFLFVPHHLKPVPVLLSLIAFSWAGSWLASSLIWKAGALVSRGKSLVQAIAQP